MNKFGMTTLLVALSVALPGCELFDDADDMARLDPVPTDPTLTYPTPTDPTPTDPTPTDPTPTDPTPTDPTPTDPTPTPPAGETYTVAIKAVDMINIDSGQTISVEGFPVQGGVLTVE
jgi:hypothetical protein